MSGDRESCTKQEGIPESDSKRRRRRQNQGSWSDLPLEIIEQIFQRLRLIDLFRIRPVCKTWSNVSRQLPSLHKFPWGMSFGETGCFLIDPPVYGKRNRVAEDVMNKIKEETPYLSASSNGWLLFKGHEPNTIYNLYSPFTTEVIQLRSVPLKNNEFHIVTFNLDANSPKCVIFVLAWDVCKLKICICRLSSGEMWKTFNYSAARVSLPVHAAYGGGCFY